VGEKLTAETRVKWVDFVAYALYNNIAGHESTFNEELQQ